MGDIISIFRNIDILTYKYRYFVSIFYSSIFLRIDIQPFDIGFRCTFFYHPWWLFFHLTVSWYLSCREIFNIFFLTRAIYIAFNPISLFISYLYVIQISISILHVRYFSCINNCTHDTYQYDVSILLGRLSLISSKILTAAPSRLIFILLVDNIKEHILHYFLSLSILFFCCKA